jgi:hypothetical protein
MEWNTAVVGVVKPIFKQDKKRLQKLQRCQFIKQR